MAHRHKDSRGKWTTTDDAEPHPADVFTSQEVDWVKLLVVAAGGGGTTPVPNPPPTPPPAITPQNVTVSGVTTTSANVAWSTTDASTGLVEYGTTTGYGSSTSSTSSGTSGNRSLTGLTPGQTYHFRVVTNSGTTTLMSGDRQFTTTAAATLPGAPQNLVATGGNAQVVLTWAAPSSNGGSAITGYRVFRNGSSIATPGNVLTYTATGLTNGTTYAFTVAAITAVGEGPQSNTASATPAAAGDTNPPNVSNVVITVLGQTSIRVAFNSDENATARVRYGQSTAYGSATSWDSSGTSHSFDITGLPAGTLYHFGIEAKDASNNLRQDGDRTSTTQPIPGSGTVTVGSLSALTNALAVNQNTDITLSPGTYSGDVWIDSRFASRTNPVTVRCSGVTLQGRLTFRGGAHHQTWLDLSFANITISQTGLIVFGGYEGEAGPHHITLDGFTVASSVKRTSPDHTTDHAVFFSVSVGGAHDIDIIDLTVDASGAMSIADGISMDHGDATNARLNAWNVNIIGFEFTGNRGLGEPTVQNAVTLWSPPIHDWTFNNITATNINGNPIRYRAAGTRINVSNFVSTNSAAPGVYCDFSGCPGLVLGSGNSFG